MRAIIPAAGFGSRMNMKPNQSKEMLIDPVTNQPVIQYVLNLCEQYALKPLIITRKEKKDLYNYVNNQGYDVLVIEPKGEWPDSILASSGQWEEQNILILPDTRFRPTDRILDMKAALDLGSKSAFAIHDVKDATKWCVIRDYEVIEKPSEGGKAWAMGLVAFTKDEGWYLFHRLRHRGSAFQLKNASFSILDSFIDITRRGVIEIY